MVQAIHKYLQSKVSFDISIGGLFIWLRLPEKMYSDELLPLACKEGVSFVPGNYFFIDNEHGREWLRLNFASQPVEDIEEGIKRLGKAIRQASKRTL